jgi:hypothetical protein
MQNISFVLSQCYAVTTVPLLVTKLERHLQSESEESAAPGALVQDMPRRGGASVGLDYSRLEMCETMTMNRHHSVNDRLTRHRSFTRLYNGIRRFANS